MLKSAMQSIRVAQTFLAIFKSFNPSSERNSEAAAKIIRVRMPACAVSSVNVGICV